MVLVGTSVDVEFGVEERREKGGIEGNTSSYKDVTSPFERDLLYTRTSSIIPLNGYQ